MPPAFVATVPPMVAESRAARSTPYDQPARRRVAAHVAERGARAGGDLAGQVRRRGRCASSRRVDSTTGSGRGSGRAAPTRPRVRCCRPAGRPARPRSRTGLQHARDLVGRSPGATTASARPAPAARPVGDVLLHQGRLGEDVRRAHDAARARASQLALRSAECRSRGYPCRTAAARTKGGRHDASTRSSPPSLRACGSPLAAAARRAQAVETLPASGTFSFTTGNGILPTWAAEDIVLIGVSPGSVVTASIEPHRPGVAARSSPRPARPTRRPAASGSSNTVDRRERPVLQPDDRHPRPPRRLRPGRRHERRRCSRSPPSARGRASPARPRSPRSSAACGCASTARRGRHAQRRARHLRLQPLRHGRHRRPHRHPRPLIHRLPARGRLSTGRGFGVTQPRLRASPSHHRPIPGRTRGSIMITTYLSRITALGATAALAAALGIGTAAPGSRQRRHRRGRHDRRPGRRRSGPDGRRQPARHHRRHAPRWPLGHALRQGRAHPARPGPGQQARRPSPGSPPGASTPSPSAASPSAPSWPSTHRPRPAG